MKDTAIGAAALEADIGKPATPPARVHALGLLGALVAFAYLFATRLDWREFTDTLLATDWRFLPLIFVGQLAFVTLGAVSVWLVVAPDRRLALGTLLRAYWRCVAVGYWTPLAAGELSLAWLLRPHGVPLRDGLAGVTVDKILSFISITVFAGPVLGSIVSRLKGHSLQGGAFSVLAATLGLIAVLALTRRLPSARRWWKGAAVRGVGYFAAMLRIAREKPGRVAANLCLSIIRTGVGIAALWWAIAAYDTATVPFFHLLASACAARLAAFALPTPLGLGVYEVSLIELLSPIDLPAASILSAVLVTRAVHLVIIGLGLLVAGVRR